MKYYSFVRLGYSIELDFLSSIFLFLWINCGKQMNALEKVKSGAGKNSHDCGLKKTLKKVLTLN